MAWSTLLEELAIDAVSIALLAYAVYYRRHRRADLSLAFVALNAGVFAAVSLLAAQRVELALGFGLFGILSIVRLRSSAITQVEVGYYFVSLTLGLVNGLGQHHLGLVLLLDGLLLAVMFALDRPRIGRGLQRRTVTLDVVHVDETELRADLERRLGGEVVSVVVTETDYVRDVTVCEVALRAPGRVRTPAVVR